MKNPALTIAGLAASLTLLGCTLTPGSTDNRSAAPSFDPVPLSSGSTVKVSIGRSQFSTQYVASQVEQIAVGLYKVNAGDEDDGPIQTSVAGGIYDTTNLSGFTVNTNVGAAFTGTQDDSELFNSEPTGGTSAYDLVQTLPNWGTTPWENYMLKLLDYAGSPQTITFFNVPDGQYKIFGFAFKDLAMIGNGAYPVNFSDTGTFTVNPALREADGTIPVALSIHLDDNADVKGTVTIEDNQDDPGFTPVKAQAFLQFDLSAARGPDQRPCGSRVPSSS